MAGSIQLIVELEEHECTAIVGEVLGGVCIDGGPAEVGRAGVAVAPCVGTEARGEDRGGGHRQGDRHQGRGDRSQHYLPPTQSRWPPSCSRAQHISRYARVKSSQYTQYSRQELSRCSSL